jgi:hypothetical protein
VSCLAGTTTCYAVGESGTILKTVDGSTWSPQTSGTTNILFSVACTDTNTCYAVGGSGTILSTTNGGTTWTPRTSGTTNDLYAVACTAATACDAVGVAGTVLTTADGSTWTQSPNQFSGPVAELNAGPFNDLFGVTCSTGACFIVTGTGNVLVAAGAPVTPATYSFSTPAGWYLVGGSPWTTWGDADTSLAWDAFRGHWYAPTSTVPVGTGAWEHVGPTAAASHSVSVQTCASPVTVTVQPHRWNIVGNPCNRAVNVPAGSRALLYQGGRYVVSTSIPEGLAAWVLPASGNLQLT